MDKKRQTANGNKQKKAGEVRLLSEADIQTSPRYKERLSHECANSTGKYNIPTSVYTY